MKSIGLIMERNEELIFKDTLDHLSSFVEKIIVFDDASTDNSLQIAKGHQSVLEVIENKLWDPRQIYAQTKNRQALLDAAKKYSPEWLFYADADERFMGDIPAFLSSRESEGVDGVRISLFDAYLTKEDHRPYTGGELFNSRNFFGTECRNILMLWRNKPEIGFWGRDAREPWVDGKIITRFYCQHYGKAISVKDWEAKCQFYEKYFPKYKKKWAERKGKAIHTKSNFGGSLGSWEDAKQNQKITYEYKYPNMLKRLFSRSRMLLGNL